MSGGKRGEKNKEKKRAKLCNITVFCNKGTLVQRLVIGGFRANSGFSAAVYRRHLENIHTVWCIVGDQDSLSSIQRFWSKLLNIGICLLAVDEAHCISEWGHNFRVEYKQLDKLRDVLINVPFVGLTATATENYNLVMCILQLHINRFLTENLNDVYKTISVSPDGMHFLSSCTPDHQPPLLLPVGEEEHKNAIGDGGDLNMDFLKSEGLLQDALLENRSLEAKVAELSKPELEKNTKEFVEATNQVYT
ncbi:hypothetical protein POM88_052979 [Heracleum sosnowskyi]|uniref:Helicase ATP-binding domain-containing protein n=1 Tax=Heracleum sosnowskyi TaxID=360622 RepID=A0AAD8GSA8_9APIA|nr:hypothetical protein POM88_052979 [Heracleum sosnowskyi]